MYKDGGTEMFKGEALITYFKPESVDLAINILDGSCLRASEGKSLPEMKVEKADFDKGKGKEENGGKGKGKEKEGNGDVGGDEKKRGNGGKKVLTEQEKKKVQKRMARIQG